jgi:hypothetical protein
MSSVALLFSFQTTRTLPFENANLALGGSVDVEE